MNNVKKKISDLALFGGTPTFGKPHPIGQLYKPSISKFLFQLRKAFKNRRLTNDGPIVKRLEKKCAEFHNVPHAIAVTNAGVGISLVLRVLAQGRKGEVILPGFSFRGLPHFICWAGLKPRFVDVDEKTHSLNIGLVKKAIRKNTIAILSVTKCHSFGVREELCELAKSLGVALVFDSVYAMGATYHGKPTGGYGTAEIFSLHATKIINGFEGGYITTRDAKLAESLRRTRNFCFEANSKEDNWIVGTNGKLNEMHAAMALASLLELKKNVAKNLKRFFNYKNKLKKIKGISLLDSHQKDIESMSHVLNILKISKSCPFTRDQLVTLLKPEGLNVNPYYSPPISRSPTNPKNCKTFHLPISEKLAKEFLQLPSGYSMKNKHIETFSKLLEFLWKNSRAIKINLK